MIEFVEAGYTHHFGVFEYSHELGTLAEAFTDDVPDHIKKMRCDELMQIQQKISLEKNKKFLGKTIPVIIDKNNKICIGRRYCDAPEVDGAVYVSAAEKIPVGSIIPVTITEADIYDLKGINEYQREI